MRAHRRGTAIDLQCDRTTAANVLYERQGGEWIVADVEDLHAHARTAGVADAACDRIALGRHGDREIEPAQGHHTTGDVPRAHVRRHPNGAAPCVARSDESF